MKVHILSCDSLEETSQRTKALMPVFAEIVNIQLSKLNAKFEFFLYIPLLHFMEITHLELSQVLDPTTHQLTIDPASVNTAPVHAPSS